MQHEHRTYMRVAKAISTASYCLRAKVGCILVKDGNIISFGYNGSPSGFPNICEMDDETLPTTLHAESNAITKCAKSGISCAGATLYITMAPCLECAKLLIQCEIKKVIYGSVYRKTDGLDLLAKAGIFTHHIDEDTQSLKTA